MSVWLGTAAAELGRPVFDGDAVGAAGQSRAVVDLHPVAEAAGQELRHRAAEDLAGQVPERDVDTADSRNVGLKSVLQTHHLLVEFVDVEWVGADEDALEPQQVGAGSRSGDAGLADAIEAGVGVDPHEALAGGVLELHCLEAGDADAAVLRSGFSHRSSSAYSLRSVVRFVVVS